MKPLLPWIILGLVIRLALIPAYVHPDLKGFNFGAYLISQQGQLLTFYDYLSSLPAGHQLVRQYHPDLFIYPPLAYLTPALFMKLLSPFYPWPVFNQFIFDAGNVASSSHMILLTYLLKIPYLLADFLSLWLIIKLADAKSRQWAGLLWIFNPVTLYSTYLIGQFDIYLVAAVLLALYFSSDSRPRLAAITLGLAAAFKPFPLFFLPFLPGSKVKNVALGLAAYLLVLLAYLPSPGFRSFALLASQSEKIQFAKVMVSASQYLPLFFVGLIFLVWKHRQNPTAFPIYGWLAAVCLLFYSLSHWHPQWFIWATPFLTLWAAAHPPVRVPLLALLGLYFLLGLTFEPSLNFQILRLNFSLAAWLDNYHMADYFASALRGAFAATTLFLLTSVKHRS